MDQTLVSESAPMLAAFSAGTHGAEPKYWRDGKAVPWVAIAAWETDGRVTTVVGENEVKRAPANAVRYRVQSVTWPTATVRVYQFAKAGRGVLHAITDETAIFVNKGSIKVNVGGKMAVARAADVVAYPSGIVRTGDAIEDVLMVTWNTGPVSTDAPIPVVVHPDAAITTGGSNGVTMIRRYAYSGNSVRYAEMAPNRPSPPSTGPADNYIYLLEGHVQYSQGGETYDVHGGDFLMQESGALHAWDQKDGAKFVASSAVPKGKAQMAPTEAFSPYNKFQIEK